MSAEMEDVQRGLTDLGLTGLQPDAFVARMNELLPEELQMDRDAFQEFLNHGLPTNGDGSVDLPTFAAWLCLQHRQRKPR